LFTANIKKANAGVYALSGSHLLPLSCHSRLQHLHLKRMKGLMESMDRQVRRGFPRGIHGVEPSSRELPSKEAVLEWLLGEMRSAMGELADYIQQKEAAEGFARGQVPMPSPGHAEQAIRDLLIPSFLGPFLPPMRGKCLRSIQVGSGQGSECLQVWTTCLKWQEQHTDAWMGAVAWYCSLWVCASALVRARQITYAFTAH
jgi:hypothetical protein